MNDVSNGDLLDVLLSMKQDIGEIKSTTTANKDMLTTHAASITDLKMTQAKQKGVLSALAAVGGALGAAVGYAAEYFHKG